MLASPPFEGIQFASSTDLFVACQQFALGEGYAVNKRSIEEARGRLRLKCAHNITEPTLPQGATADCLLSPNI
jgi:hypothetical protein